jgi:CRISPR-associated protein Cas1
LGFVHTGKALSFVYDISDLYKADISIPLAFKAVAQNPAKLESEVRHSCRDFFYLSRLLERILPDIDRLFDLEAPIEDTEWNIDEDPARPTPYWNPPAQNP